MLKRARWGLKWGIVSFCLAFIGSAVAQEVQTINPRARSRAVRVVRPSPRPSGARVVRPKAAPSRATQPRTVQPSRTNPVISPGSTVQPGTTPSLSTVEPTTPTATAEPRPTRPTRPARRSSGDEIDLSTLTGSSVPTARSEARSSGGAEIRPPHGSSGIIPNFKFYYDFVIRHWANHPRGEPTVSFDSYHQRFMVEFIPYPELMFSADLSPNPYFFEVDYQLTPRLQLRWGKIWIPFDDLAPHSIFGGRINTSKLVSGNNELPFLPDIWAELGMGLKYQLIDGTSVASELHLYVTNGFQDGATDPKGTAVAYPNFSGTSGVAPDNNNNKAIGARLHTKFGGQTFGLGVSGYRAVYTSQAQPEQSMTLLGIDTQLRPSNRFETRAGIMFGTVGLSSPPADEDSFTRGGLYVEQGIRFGENLAWKLLGRAGTAQADNRVIDTSDKQIVGVSLLKRVRSLEFSLHFDRDLKKVETKSGYNFGFFRIVAAF